MAWRLLEFPIDQVAIRAKTGSAEVYGKQSTSWVASYTKDYVVVMMVSQGGTGSGTSGPAIRKIYETLYGVKGMKVVPDDAAIPGVAPPERLPVFAEDGSILPPSTAPDARRQGLLMALLAPGRPSSTSRNRAPLARPRTIRTESSLARVPRLDWLLLVATAALLVLGTMLVWSATAERDVAHRRRLPGLPAPPPGQHRHRRRAGRPRGRHRAPLGAHPRARRCTSSR